MYQMSAGDFVSETLGSNPAFSRGIQLVSYSKIACLCQSIESNNKHTKFEIFILIYEAIRTY